jgi:hypothetical protein
METISDYTMQDAKERVAEARQELKRADDITERLLSGFGKFTDAERFAMLNEVQSCKGRAAYILLNFVEIRIIGEASA